MPVNRGNVNRSCNELAEEQGVQISWLEAADDIELHRHPATISEVRTLDKAVCHACMVL